MSVLINGIQMPKNGPFLVKINPDGSVSTTAKNGYKKYEAVSVPPHGRLIDADILARDLDDVENDQRALDEMNFVGKEREHVQFDRDCKQNCIWYLSNAPTIIPAEQPREKT